MTYDEGERLTGSILSSGSPGHSSQSDWLWDLSQGRPAFARVTSSSSVSLLRPTLALLLPDTMVCTGCCSCLDHIVTYLFKQLSRSTKKRTTPLNQESDRFLHIMQQHPEMIQQVRSVSAGRQCGLSRGGGAAPGKRGSRANNKSD